VFRDASLLSIAEVVGMQNILHRRDFMKIAGAVPAVGAMSGGFGVAASVSRMKAGTAKVDVTPRHPRVCANGRRPDPPTVYHPIHARCLTLHDGSARMVFVTYDFNCLDVATPILRERVERELNIPPSHLVLLATHNHQSPIQIVPDNFDYGRYLAEEIFTLIQRAIADEDGPIQLYFGHGQGYFIIASGNAPIDHEVQLLKVMKGQKPVAFLFNHPTHPLSGPDGYGPSHPGFAMDLIEEKHPGALALYAEACGGNQFCRPPRNITDRLEACKQRGRDLAEVVLKIADGPTEEVTGEIESQLKVVDLPLAPPVSYKEALELARGIPLDIGFVPFPDRRRLHNWIRALVQHYREGRPFPTKSSDYVCTDDAFLVPELPEPRKYECRYEEVLAARIGRLNLVAIQGEPCAPMGARIRDVLRYENPTMVFGYFAEHNLYIPTREIVRQDDYQSQVIRIQYASPVGWAAEVEDVMVAEVLALYGTQIWQRRRG
jgi:neutral ceramidase